MRRRLPRRRATGQSRRSAPLAELDFPTIVHDRLSNGIPIDYVQRTGVPVTQLALAFDAGDAADSPSARGLAGFTMGLLDEGTAAMTSQEFAEAEERLGANVSASNSGDRSYAMLNALSPNLAPSLDLLSDVVLRPGVHAGRDRAGQGAER